MKDEIIELYKSLCEASVKKDKEKLNDILSSDYTLTHMTGLIQTKDEYINSVINGELKYFDLHESVDVVITDDFARVVGKTNTLASVFGIAKSWWRLRQDLIVKKIDDKWIIESSVASTY